MLANCLNCDCPINMYISRTITESIIKRLKESSKIIILYGARQVGKTTLIKKILSELPYKILEVSGDERKYSSIFSSRDLNKLKLLCSGYDLVFIDEAQRIPDIGINLKILNDNIPNLKIIATGSSSFDLSNKIKEPLTGRTWTYKLYPISFNEILSIFSPFETIEKLEELLVFGSYPEIFNLNNIKDKRNYLQEVSSSYLYKDILEISTIKNSYKIHDLLRLLAFQIGSLVSLQELGKILGMSKDTVASYIDLLENSFVLFRLNGYSRNLRKEVTKMSKIYFYDLGIRNIIIENLKECSFRNDIGQLWENYFIMERIKYLHNKQTMLNPYFWRLYSGVELDYIEEGDGELVGFELKYSPKIKVKAPATWKSTYPNAGFYSVNKDNFMEFIKGK